MHALAHARHDFYQLPEYVELVAKYEGGEPVAFYAEDNGIVFLAPLLLRKLPADLNAPADWYDAVTSHGYPTPIMSPAGNAADLERFFGCFKQLGAERGIISAFFRMHPLLALPLDVLSVQGLAVNHGQTVYMDLSVSCEDIWAQIRRNHKRDIKKLVKEGFQVGIDDGGRFHEFSDIYAMTMERVGAQEFFRFSDDYFNDLRLALGERLKMCTVLSPSGELASAVLCVVTNGIMQCYLGATSDAHLGQAPSKLVYDFAWRWGKAHECRFLFLGGGAGGESGSIMRLKIGFSKSLADFYTYRMVLDESRYEVLMRNRKESHNEVSDEGSNFFPEYRRP